jgi:hypothetical protein
LNAYLHFAHEDAWDAVVDYFGSASLFRGFTDILHDDTKELSWRMSINIAHIILEPGTERDTTEPRDRWKPPKDVVSDKDERAFRNVCSTICTTGDRLGEFWTCSFLGPFCKPKEGQKKSSQSPAQKGSERQRSSQSQLTIKDMSTGKDTGHQSLLVFDMDKVTKINERYKFDKYSARNLVFIVQLTRLIWILSGLYENVAQYLEDTMKLEVQNFLQSSISSSSNTLLGQRKIVRRDSLS